MLEKAPELLGALVSHDQKAALVTASFVTDRLENPETYRTVFDHVYSIVEREEDENHRLFVTGTPIVTGWVLAHAWEIGLSMVGAVVLIFGLLWAYFRRWHGVLIPSVAAVVTVFWGLGFIGWMGIVLDPLVLVIPMIITAPAVSHTVQMAERFFEDYERLAPRFADPQRAKLEAASVAMAELIVPGTLGILTDVAGLLVIYGEGDRPDSVGEQRFLLDLEELERTLRRDSGASGCLSLPLLVRNAQQLLQGGDPKFHFVPPTASVWVLMVRTNSPPSALGPIVDPSGRVTASTIHYRDHKGETIERAVRVAEHYMVGPLLPTRAHTLRVKHRTGQAYEDLPVVEAAESGLPPWMEEFREAALERYEDERLAGRPGARFLWPANLADWDTDDVDQWWDGTSFGIRAVAVNTRDLLVQDLRSPTTPSRPTSRPSPGRGAPTSSSRGE